MRIGLRPGFLLAAFLTSTACLNCVQALGAAPTPLLNASHPVNWWFVFKLNSEVFPHCEGNAQRSCPFGGTVQSSSRYKYGQQFVYASNEKSSLTAGTDCAGDSANDPIGATYGEIYNGSYFYVVWNDQFYDHPIIHGCTKECGSPWGHSKGILAWDASGSGVILQVSTPSWPGSGSHDHPRSDDGNSLGCIEDDDVKVSQHFFAVKLDKADVEAVLRGLANASVVTDTGDAQLVHNGGPSDIQSLVSALGIRSSSEQPQMTTLSTGIVLISKPSKEHVPPWQLVSHELGNIPLRVATWWTNPAIPSTSHDSKIDCWPAGWGNPGAVDIATTGSWDGHTFSLEGGPGGDRNHAKMGVSTDENHPYVIFGDMNQQGTLSGTNCGSSQNGRGGMFFVLTDSSLHTTIGQLISGNSAPQ